jgi:hypothetical protein
MRSIEQELCQNMKVSVLQRLSDFHQLGVAVTWRDPRRMLANAANRRGPIDLTRCPEPGECLKPPKRYAKMQKALAAVASRLSAVMLNFPEPCPLISR